MAMHQLISRCINYFELYEVHRRHESSTYMLYVPEISKPVRLEANASLFRSGRFHWTRILLFAIENYSRVPRSLGPVAGKISRIYFILGRMNTAGKSSRSDARFRERETLCELACRFYDGGLSPTERSGESTTNEIAGESLHKFRGLSVN